jgi:uncharacterized protein
MTENDQSKVIKYYVAGIHCGSCQIIIERKLSEEKGINSVALSNKDNSIVIKYDSRRPSIEYLNKLFKKENYKFSKEVQAGINKTKDLFITIAIALLVFGGFLLLNKSGITSVLNVNASSGLGAFFVFGVLAGLSTCSALVGGIILAMSKQWQKLYGKNDSIEMRMQPHVMFNLGRIVSYILVGILLGALGSVFQFSLNFSSMLSILVSLVMVFLGLQMLGVKALSRFSIASPKFFSRFVSDEKNFSGKFMPALMGAGTILLPCGFTITTQSLALLSGDPIKGGLIMLVFALGTLPALLAIGYTSVISSQKSKFSQYFSKIAGVLVLLFAIFNINAALNAMALPSLSDINFGSSSKVLAARENGLVSIKNGKQIIEMDALAYGYEPNSFKVKVGVPVRWEITDQGTSGCTNAVVSKGLFDGEINLIPGKTSIQEFTPEKVGKYKFSCWMGMISGVIEVVDSSASSGPSAARDGDFQNDVIESGAAGCGGSCDGSCGGGCGGNTCGYK